MKQVRGDTCIEQADGTPPPAFSLPGRGNFYALWKFSSRKKIFYKHLQINTL